MIWQVLKLLAADCPGTSSFLGFPNWYRHLECDADGGVKFSGFYDVWAVVANLAEILIRLAGLLAIIFMIFGGIVFITSHGDPDQIKRARDILVNAFWGLVFAVIATALVSFIAGRF